MAVPTFPQFLWRFSTGQFLDGNPRKSHRVNHPLLTKHEGTWWSRKPRWKRALWRWTIVSLMPAGAVAYHYLPTVQTNLFLVLMAVTGPFLAWRIACSILLRIPHTRVIVVTHDVPTKLSEVEDDSVIVDMIPPHELDNEISELEMIAPPDDPEWAELTAPKRGASTRRKMTMSLEREDQS